MQIYPAYKPSGIDWIGDIPSHWEVKKLKYLGQSIIGVTYSPDNITQEASGTLVLRSSNIQNGKLALDDCVYINKEISDKLITKKGDILICARNGSADLIGKNICIDHKTVGKTFGAFMVVVRSDYWVFLSWFFNSSIFKAQSGLFSTSTINQLTNDVLDNMNVAYPADDSEQAAIARYLDEKTAQLDTLIARKRRLIDLLREEKAALINEAVTKSIRPGVEMKPSGIEWLGEVPAHWEVKKLKWVASLQSGESITSESIQPEGEYPVYGGNGLRGYTSAYTNEGDYVLIGRQGALCGNINYASGQFWASEHAVIATLIGDINFIWLGELLRTMNLNQYSVSAAQPGLAIERIQTLSLPVPPFQEQVDIAQYIDTEAAKIDYTISRIEREVELMQEYRTALISEVVTGKVYVLTNEPVA